MSSNARRQILIVACALALAIATGVWFFLRKAESGFPKDVAGVAPSPPAATTRSPSGASAPSAGTDEDLRSALDLARANPDPKLRAQEFGRALRRCLELDPNAALAYLRQLPKTSAEYTQGVLMLVEWIARREPERALALARELASTREQLAIYSSLFVRFAQQDIPSALQRLPLAPPGLARENAVRAIADTWVRIDLPGALAWAQTLANPADRAAALEVAVTELATKAPLQAIEFAHKSLNGPALERTVSRALEALTATDPHAASGLISLLPAGEMQTLAAVEVARALAAQDVGAALSWAKSLSPEAVRWLATNRVLEAWATADPGAASRYVLALPQGREQHDSAVFLAGVLAEKDPSNALAWAQSLQAESTRPIALANIINTWARRDAAAAARWVAEQPPAMLGGAAPKALNAALSYWALQDTAGVQEFVRTLAPAVQAVAAEFVAPLLSQANPAGTLTWAQTLPIPDARDRAIQSAYARWRENAPAAAQAWLAASNLPPEIRARLQESP